MVSGEWRPSKQVPITAIVGKENKYADIAFFSEIVFSSRSCYKSKKNCSLILIFWKS